MNVVATAALVVVLGLATWAGVAFSCGSAHPPSSSLVWLYPGGSAFPASDSYILCSESGAKSSVLLLSASPLAPGDGCQFTATLFNAGDRALFLSNATVESTPAGAPPFSDCFSFSFSGGPAHDKLGGGDEAPYVFTIQFSSTAPDPAACEGVVGNATVTFTGTPVCWSPAALPAASEFASDPL